MKYVLNTIPSGIFHPNCINLVGNGVVIDPIALRKEINGIQKMDIDPLANLYISKKAHLILPTHLLLDAASETAKGEKKIGSTLRGISPAYQDKIGRCGLRVGDILVPGFEQKYKDAVARHLDLLEYYNAPIDIDKMEETWFDAIGFLKTLKLVDGEHFINRQISQGKRILAEGAQGTLLDVDFGSYPYVTSSNTISAGACTGLGIAPKHIGKVIGIFKAYCTRVGGGPFPTQLDDHHGEQLRHKGHEYGATTGRPRRCGWIDLPALKYAIMLNGVSHLIITKSDVLSGFDTVKACTAYEYYGNMVEDMPYNLEVNQLTPHYTEHPGWKEDLSVLNNMDNLPASFSKYISFIEQELGMPINIISVGPDRNQTIIKDFVLA